MNALRAQTGWRPRHFLNGLMLAATLALVASWFLPPTMSPTPPVTAIGLVASADAIRGEPIVPASPVREVQVPEPKVPPQATATSPAARPDPDRQAPGAVSSPGAASTNATTPTDPTAFPEREAGSARSGRPRLAGHQPIHFSLLASFVFDLDQAILEAQPTNLHQAIRQTLSQIPKHVLALDRRKVALEGFVLPLRFTNGLCSEFLLLRDQSMCCFGKMPRLNEWVAVHTQTPFKAELDRPQTVWGTFEVGDFRENGRLVGLYRLAAERVVAQPRVPLFRPVDPFADFPLERAPTQP